MRQFLTSALAAAALILGTSACGPLLAGAADGIAIPTAKVDDVLAASPGQAVAVFAGGCFWGVQAVFQHTRGVLRATSGYAGGAADTAHYEMVGSDTTGHAESVEVVYDPSKVTFGQLLRVFFAVAHDPTQLNYQGPDTGTQYRSVVFTANADQARIAKAYVEQLGAANVFRGKIVTVIANPTPFYPAEAYHQDYATLHPGDPYIRINDAPKVENLKALLPELYSEKKAPAR
jgi:peptide-methionine (S)-S-oxide reductase